MFWGSGIDLHRGFRDGDLLDGENTGLGVCRARSPWKQDGLRQGARWFVDMLGRVGPAALPHRLFKDDRLLRKGRGGAE